MSKVWYKSKTILAALAFGLLGLADLVGAVDLRPLLVMCGVPAEKTDGVMLLVTLVFAALRVVTAGAVTAKRDAE